MKMASENIQRILVTGGAGYVGSQTCFELSKKGYELLVYDNLSTGFKKNVRWSDLVVGDLLDKKTLFDSISKFKPDAVMHFAAKAYVGESVENPLKYFQNNVAGTLNLLDCMLANSVNKFVFSSTCATYGEPTTDKITENSPQNPINPYGQSKLIVEQILDTISKSHDFNFVAFRYFNAAGADAESSLIETHDPETHLIPLAILSAVSDFELEVFGCDFDTNDGSAVRDYIHVKDLALAHIVGLEKIQGPGKNEFFNLGSGTGVSVLEVIKTLKSLEVSPKYKIVERRQGDPSSLVADPSKAQRLLNWYPRFSEIGQILSSVIEVSKRQ